MKVLKINADSKALNSSVAKNPVYQLTEKFGKIVWNTVLVAGVHNKCCFKVSTVINGSSVFGTGTTLESAKRLCALMALELISGENHGLDCKDADGKKDSLPSSVEENEEQNYTKNKTDKKLRISQNVKDLQLNSNLNTAGKKHHNFKMNHILKCRNLKTQYIWKPPKTVSDVDRGNHDKEVIPDVLPLTLEEIEDDGNVVNEGKALTTYSEKNAILLLGRNEKHTADDCVILEQDDVTNLPSCSRQSLNVLENNKMAENCVLQSKFHSVDAEQVKSSDLGCMLRNKLNTFKSTAQNSLNVDVNNAQTIEMKECIKSLAKNPIGDGNLLFKQVVNYHSVTNITQITQSHKRLCDESIELNDLPPAKIHATGKNNVLSVQGQRCHKKDAVRYLKELQPSLNFTLVAEIGNSSEPFFLVLARVSNRKFFGHGKTKHLAEKDAAKQILNFLGKSLHESVNIGGRPRFAPIDQNCQQLVLHNQSSDEICSSLLLQPNFADIIEMKVMQAFDKITCGHHQFSSFKVVAGIIMTFYKDFMNSMVVSIATGTKCINGGNICCNGSVINDCHAEVLAKRGLMKYLLAQLKNHCSFETMENSVFERTNRGYKLKSFVHFHLYINTAPCGDARVFNFNHTNRFTNNFETSFNSLQYGQLRTKVEGELGTTPTGSRFSPQTWDGVLLGEPLHTMSCSDKVALWNVVGIQGALLSQFIEPIYLHSITLGSLFNAQHMYRALCGRIEDTLGHLPKLYRLNRPLLGQTSKRFRRTTLSVPSIGINWTMGDNDFEIISQPTGRSIYNETSFLSKQAFFFKYFYLCNNLPNLGCASISNTYGEAKQYAQDYQNAKRAVLEAFHRANLGNWVKKPKEQNEFVMNIN